MRILVTGGAGYVGSVLVEHLLFAGHDVTVLDTFTHGENSLGHLCHWPTLSVVRGDACNITGFPVSDFDVLVPLAAIVGAAACDRAPREARAVNLDAIMDLCSLVDEHQAIIFFCTNSGYGVGGEAGCTEDSPLKPVSLYADTKVTAEMFVMRRANSVSLRLATVFGMSNRMRMDLLVNDLVWRALRDRSAVIFEAEFRRNFVHVRDVARAVLHVIDNWDDMRGQIYNVGDTRANMTKRDLCVAIHKHLPFDFRVGGKSTDPDKRDYLVSNAKIEATGWSPNYSLDDGIRELIKGYVTLNPMRYRNA